MQQEPPSNRESPDARRRRLALAWVLVFVVLAVGGYLVKRAVEIYTHSVPSWDLQAAWFPVELAPGIAIIVVAGAEAVRRFIRIAVESRASCSSRAGGGCEAAGIAKDQAPTSPPPMGEEPQLARRENQA